MNSSLLSCRITNNILTLNNVFILVAIILFAGIAFVLYKTFKETSGILIKLLIGFVYLCLYVILLIVSAILLAILFGVSWGDDMPPSAGYHPVNAIVKQYCRENPEHKYCPQNANDVLIVAPEESKKLLQDAHVTYQYFPQTNDYSLIIRNSTYHTKNDNRVVIFDSRLPSIRKYSKGLDFVDTHITSNCDGTFRLTNPPPVPGPWTNIN